MSAPGRSRRRRPRRPVRSLAIVCALGAFATAATLAISVWSRGTLRAYVYDTRIREALGAWERSERPPGTNEITEWRSEDAEVWRVAEANLHALALEARRACADALARWASERRLGALSVRAMRLLCRHYPEHRFACGAREYARIAGKAYVWGTADWDRSTVRYLEVDDEQASRLHDWLERFPGHPGSDDAMLRIARGELGAGRPTAAVDLLHRALHSPDGDCFMRAHVNVRWVLDRDCGAADLVGWLDHGCPDHLRPLVTYFAAVHSMRAKSYTEAVGLFERFLTTTGALREELGVWHDSCFVRPGPRRHCFSAEHVEASARTSVARVFEHATEQLELSRRLAELAEAHRLAPDGAARARALYALGRACFERPRSFRNVFVDPRYADRYRHTGKEDTPEECVAALPLDLGYRHAADYFRRVLTEHPASELSPRAAYSVPLCLWRTKILLLERTLRGASPSFSLAIARGFQAFAERYPDSSMADEALYSAGVHFYWARRWDGGLSAEGKLVANLDRIASEYPDGNIAKDYRDRNGLLRRALEAVEATEEPTGGPDSIR